MKELKGVKRLKSLNRTLKGTQLGGFPSGWGVTAFLMVSVVGGARSVAGSGLGHFRIFTSAARALWHGMDAYGTDFGTGVGLWFYSPACGMVVFGPLSLLPEPLGLALYLFISWVAFVWGANKLWKSFGATRVPDLFWLLVAVQMMTSLLAAKLEILMMGLLMWACAEVIRTARARLRAGSDETARLGWEPAAVLGALLNWKFQPLPTVGLLTIVWMLRPAEGEPRDLEAAAQGLIQEDEIARRFRFPVAVAFNCLLWFAAPVLWFGLKPALGMLMHWKSTLQPFLEASYLNFDNIFAFLRAAFGISVTYDGAQKISIAVGLVMAVAVTMRLRFSRWDARWSIVDSAAMAMSLGAVYTVVLSPLSQNNAHVLLAPLFMCAMITWRRLDGDRLGQWVHGLSLGLLVVALDFAYSDLIPADLRTTLRGLAIKPAAVALFGLVETFLLFRAGRDDELI